jgi:hypothetical protein
MAKKLDKATNKGTKYYVFSFLLSLPLIAFVLSVFALQFNDTIHHQTLVVQPEFTNGILSAYGILIGFWAAIIGLSPKEHKVLWKNVDVIKTIFFISLGFLVLSVFIFAFQAIGIAPPILGLFSSTTGFYLTCLFLGITLNEIIFRKK